MTGDGLVDSTPRNLEPLGGAHSRRLRYSPDLLEAFGYHDSIPFDASASFPPPAVWGSNSISIANEVEITVQSRGFVHAQTRESDGRALDPSHNVDDRGASRGLVDGSLKRLRRPVGREHDQDVTASQAAKTQATLETSRLQRLSRNHAEQGPVPVHLAVNGISPARQPGESPRSKHQRFAREKNSRAGRQTLKPRSNNGAMPASNHIAHHSMAGFKRRYADESHDSVQLGSVRESLSVAREHQLYGSLNGGLETERRHHPRRTSGGQAQDGRNADFIDQPATTSAFGDRKRPRAGAKPITTGASMQRPETTSFGDEDRSEIDSESSIDNDLAIIPSHHSSFAVPEENRIPPRRNPRGVELPRQRQRSFTAHLLSLQSHFRGTPFGSLGRSTNREVGQKSIQRSRAPTYNRIHDRSSTTDDGGSEAETLIDEDETGGVLEIRMAERSTRTGKNILTLPLTVDRRPGR